MANFLVIAASSGIGQATAALLERHGHGVFRTARDDRKIAPDATLGATDFQATEEVFTEAEETLGGLDGVVNCAGALLLKPAHGTDEAQYREIIESCLTTAFATLRAAARHFIQPGRPGARQGGSVVLLSSAAASVGLANHEAIAAAKAGVEGLVRAAAATYAPNNLRVNAVAPGLTLTPLTSHLTSTDAARKVSESMHPLGRLGQPEDIARAIAFLLDPANAWITGQVLGVDGGLATLRGKMKA